MALKEYEVEIGGLPHVLQLSEADAKNYEGATEVKKTSTKQAAAQNKQAPAADDK
jgi:hypothetical protein